MAKFTPEEILAKVAAGERLEGADLCGADLRNANLTNANFSFADLRGADMRYLPTPLERVYS